jgi:hypothetical protein
MPTVCHLKRRRARLMMMMWKEDDKSMPHVWSGIISARVEKRLKRRSNAAVMMKKETEKRRQC